MIFGVTGGGKGMLINTFITHMLLSYPRTEHDEDSEMAVSAGTDSSANSHLRPSRRIYAFG